MSESETYPKLLGGVDHRLFDQRPFDPSKDDIETICRFFSLGKLKAFEKEKDVVISHSNFFAFAASSRGEFAFKFYPDSSQANILNEFVLNRFLGLHEFPTPAMYTGNNNSPACSIGDFFVTCLDYVNGQQAWASINKPWTYRMINRSMHILKEILSQRPPHLRLTKQTGLDLQIKELGRLAIEFVAQKDRQLIMRHLEEDDKFYAGNKGLFPRRLLHNNASLTNFLIHKKEVYTLDLTHIREDYHLSDLANFMISCLLFEVRLETIRALKTNYFQQHRMKPELALQLGILIRVGLIREFVKNRQRELKIGRKAGANAMYVRLLKARLRSINDTLKRMAKSTDFLL